METLLLIASGGAVMVILFHLRARLAGFQGQLPKHYEAARSGQFDIRHHLNGPLLCEGVIYGPLGRVTSRFEADFDASWSGNVGTMAERFRYDDGSTQDRAWTLHIGNDGHIRALAEDVVGEGEGWQSGDAVQLKYRLRLSETAGGHELDVVDWMYLTPNGTIMNRSQFRKFGFKVAELVATIRPLREQRGQAA